MELRIQRDDQHRKYFAVIDGQEAQIRFEPVDAKTLDFQHTEVPVALRGHGVGEELIREALADVRSRGERIVATCPFVKKYLARHPEDQPLAVPAAAAGGRPQE